MLYFVLPRSTTNTLAYARYNSPPHTNSGYSITSQRLNELYHISDEGINDLKWVVTDRGKIM